MESSVSRLLAEVEADLRRRYSRPAPPPADRPSEAALSSSSPAVTSSLALLTPEDWTAVLNPLAPDPQYPSLDPTRYVQLRCAELPMRLQMEALQTRRYEHLLRQHTRELIVLSEFVTLVSRAPPTLAAPPRNVTDQQQQQQQQQQLDVSQLPSDVRVLLAPTEVPRRLERAQERIRELEAMLRQEAEAKVQCCQRMVLLSEYVRTLVQHVRVKSSEGKNSAGLKRPRAEAEG